LAFVLLPFIPAAVIGSIGSPCVIISSILIARGVTATIVVYVFALVVGRDFRAFVIVGRHFFAEQRFRVRVLSTRFILSGLRVRSGRVRRLRSARRSQNAEQKAEQERKKFVHSDAEPSQEA